MKVPPKMKKATVTLIFQCNIQNLDIRSRCPEGKQTTGICKDLFPTPPTPPRSATSMLLVTQNQEISFDIPAPGTHFVLHYISARIHSNV